jgi:tRNA threonylcarbamoyladenosine biosynthesis protein TsaB
MIILAIDQSSAFSSIALLRDDVVIAGREWDEKGMRNQYVFTALPELLSEASVSLADIDMFAVGLGPGAFSGLRISLSALRGIALPTQKPVFGVSSAEAIARSIALKNGRTEIAVIGDARRGLFWLGRFNVSDNSGSRSAPALTLAKPDALSSLIKADATVVSPDWDRIGQTLGEILPATVKLIKEKRVPSAKVVGQLAYRKSVSGEPSLPLLPIYLHPPVFVPPSFPADKTNQ